MRVVVVGSGGREHALAWGLSRSPSVEKVFCAPGNAGIADVAVCEPIAPGDAAAIADFAGAQGADLIVIGPEAPLVDGEADRLRERGLRVFGPSAAAAMLEGSKAYAKDVMRRAGIPTAFAETFTDVERAINFLREFGAPCVVKADGLAAGKGVRVCENLADAADAVHEALQQRAFGDAGATIVIEECLTGEEISVFALSDGTRVVPLASAQDHKRIGDGDTGPNTGGMGAYSPVPHLDVVDRVMAETFEPLVAQMAADGAPFTGVIFGGFMVGDAGPKVLEFNVRFGDPETQAIVPRLESDLGEILFACAGGTLDGVSTRLSTRAAVCVVLAGDGYPARSDTGTPIDGLEEAAHIPDVTVFHAGTARVGGRIVTNGGRVLGVTGLGDTIGSARDRAYEAAGKISFKGMQYRRDIGSRALGGEAAR
ncbi:MAG TPA: phosphoribosylamine--glycine ligase [Actinomycetota bacterium]